MYREFETLLARHCAPLLCCIKPAAMLSRKTFPRCCAWRELHDKGFRFLKLFRKDGKDLVFIYNPYLLSKALDDKTVQQKLIEFGYPENGDWRQQLAHLRRRMAESKEFPHEVGFFLGYPPNDVIGFIDCKGDNSQCCVTSGPWKVFDDSKKAEQIFCDYERCRSTLLSVLESKGSILSEELSAWAV